MHICFISSLYPKAVFEISGSIPPRSKFTGRIRNMAIRLKTEKGIVDHKTKYHPPKYDEDFKGNNLTKKNIKNMMKITDVSRPFK